MAILTSLGGSALQCALNKMTLSVFPSGKDKGGAKEGAMTLIAHPEEEPRAGVISWPGEYDFNGIFVRGIGHEDGRQVSYVVDAEGIRYAFLSSPLHKMNDFELEQVGDIDVLCLPADDVKMVQELVDAIDPRVLVPLSAKDDKVYREVLKVFGAVGKEAVEEYKLKGSLPAEGREVVVLKTGK